MIPDLRGSAMRFILCVFIVMVGICAADAYRVVSSGSPRIAEEYLRKQHFTPTHMIKSSFLRSREVLSCQSGITGYVYTVEEQKEPITVCLDQYSDWTIKRKP